MTILMTNICDLFICKSKVLKFKFNIFFNEFTMLAQTQIFEGAPVKINFIT